MKEYLYLKRAILILVAIVSVVFGAFGQENVRPMRTPEQEAQRRTEMMSKQLQLSVAQAEKVYQLQLKYARLRRTATKREDFIALMHKMTDELQWLLTKEQFETYKSWLEGHRRKHPYGFGKASQPVQEQLDSLVSP